MGLDIKAYKQLSKIEVVIEGDTPIDPVTKKPLWDLFRANVNDDFPGRAGALEPGAFYTSKDSIGFSAGSYSSYNAWRENLAEIAGYLPVMGKGFNGVESIRHDYAVFRAAGGPFWEFINFSDCEGVIGCEASKKLVNDFVNFDEKAKAQSASFYILYNLWRRAFEFAADDGAVWFH